MVSSTVVEKSEKPKRSYPKSIGFIISNEFCERFNFYGMRTILVLYLTRRLGYDDDGATIIFHIFTSLVYFCPIFGAIIADSWLGRFNTILYLSVVYTVGSIIIAVGAIPPLHLPASAVTVLGLALISIGTGGIKPCVSAFGGDQFKIPEQAKQLATFFSLFYMAINAGSLLSTTITPILREDVHCFGEEDCFSLAFGVPGVLMIVSIAIFIFGKPFYYIAKPTGNMFLMVSKCVGNAISLRVKEKDDSKKHWLDYAEPVYGNKLIDDIKSLLKILVLYIPLPFFWALLDQQGSRWTFQATRMVGDVGAFTIKPDQMQVINPLLIIVFIPLWDLFVYPCLEKIGIRRPLQKLTLGMILAGCAFLVSGFIELKLESKYPVLPGPNESQIRIFNGLNCDFEITSDLPSDKIIQLNRISMFEQKHVPADKMFLNYKALSKEECLDVSGQFKIIPGEATSYFLTNGDKMTSYKESPEKPKKGFPLIRILATTSKTREVSFHHLDKDVVKNYLTNSTELLPIIVGTYDVFVDKIAVAHVKFELGASYTIILNELSETNFNLKTHVITEPNDMHILWQIPQYVIMTAGEIMFSVTGLEFSFTQAPESMKSVLQACWLITVAFGNIIVVIVAEISFFKSQASEFFLFCGLMAVDVCLFIFLALRYKYRKERQDVESFVPMSNAPSPKPSTTNSSKAGVENYAYSSDL